MRTLLIALSLIACSDAPTTPSTHDVVMCGEEWQFGAVVPTGCEFASCCEFACEHDPVADGPACTNAMNPFSIQTGNCSATFAFDGLKGCCGLSNDNVMRYFTCQ
jgi:hypothetical protein